MHFWKCLFLFSSSFFPPVVYSNGKWSPNYTLNWGPLAHYSGNVGPNKSSALDTNVFRKKVGSSCLFILFENISFWFQRLSDLALLSWDYSQEKSTQPLKSESLRAHFLSKQFSWYIKFSNISLHGCILYIEPCHNIS